MSQFEVAATIFESDTPVSKADLKNKLDLHPSSITAGVNSCIQKGYVKNTEHGYVCADGFDKENLESIRPKTIDELRE